MRCVHNEIYKKCSIKIYMDSYSYYAKTKLPNETKHYYILNNEHDLKKEAIKSAKEDIDSHLKELIKCKELLKS